jgi:beta-phosphoglucomutase-like phosphatase (HAD superfamily)
LLDADGTLLDSTAAHATAWKRALHNEGARHEQLRRLVGMGAEDP